MGEKKRGLNFATLNFAKGLAIIFVVLLHILQDFIPTGKSMILFNGLFSALMPMFTILSGYLFSEKPLKSVFVSNAVGILKPFYIVQAFNIVLYPIRTFLQGKGMIYGIKKMGSAILLVSCDEFYIGDFEVGTVGPVWFLFVLFWSWLLLTVIMYEKREWLRVVYVCLIAILGLVMAAFKFRIFTLSQICINVAFLYIGYMFKKKRIFEITLKWYGKLLLIATATIALLFSNVNMVANVYRLGFFEIVVQSALSYWLIKWCIVLSRGKGVIVDWICNAGRYSLWILCIHSVLFTSMPWQRFRKLIPNPYMCVIFLIIYNIVFIVPIGWICNNRGMIREKIGGKISGRKSN